MSCLGRIRIARHQRILCGASTGEMILVDGVIIADGVGGMGAVEISRVEVVGDDDRGCNLVSNINKKTKTRQKSDETEHDIIKKSQSRGHFANRPK
ncbi:hypothetical protein Tco_0244970 [Tanacetum coccineum]